MYSYQSGQDYIVSNGYMVPAKVELLEKIQLLPNKAIMRYYDNKPFI